MWLAAGIEAAGLATDQPDIVTRRSLALGSPWSEEDERAFEALVAGLGPARTLLDRAASLERSSTGFDYSSTDPTPPDILPLLPAARLLTVHCDLMLQRGDVAAAIDDVALLERMAAVERREPLIFSVLIGGAIERLYHDRLEAVLGAVDQTPQLERLLADLGHLERSAVSLRSALAREGAFVHAAMAKSTAEGRHGRRSTLARWGERPAREARALLRLDWLLLAEQLDGSARLASAAAQPIAGIDVERLQSEVDGGSGWVSDPITPMLLPNLLQAIRQDQATTSARRLARAALRLRRERLESGAYPAALADPPHSDYAGDQAVYRVSADGGASIELAESERAWKTWAATWVGEDEATHPQRTPNLAWRLPP